MVFLTRALTNKAREKMASVVSGYPLQIPITGKRLGKKAVPLHKVSNKRYLKKQAFYYVKIIVLVSVKHMLLGRNSKNLNKIAEIYHQTNYCTG